MTKRWGPRRGCVLETPLLAASAFHPWVFELIRLAQAVLVAVVCAAELWVILEALQAATLCKTLLVPATYEMGAIASLMGACAVGSHARAPMALGFLRHILPNRYLRNRN